MADVSKGNPSGDRVFAYWPNAAAWIIRKIDDPGLVILMKQAGAETVSKKSDDAVTDFWKVKSEPFALIRDLLIGLGFSEQQKSSNAPKTSADYKASIAMTSTKPVEKTYSVKELSECMDKTIQNAFTSLIWLKGEITEIAESKGFYYLKLIDKDAAKQSKKPVIGLIIYPNIYQDVIMPKLADLSTSLRAGLEIRILGKVSYYIYKGEGSFEVRDIDTHFAEGELARQKKLIEEQLYKLGIHDQNKRIPMPLIPLRLAVFSKMDFSSMDHPDPGIKKNTARGCEDFINTLKSSRYPFDITFFNVNLQGEFLEPSFLKAFEMLDRIGCDKFDLGIIIRGGGSVVDLSGFNNLRLATYIARSPLKFIVGIGHDQDRSALDEIAHNEKTPTAIGDLLVNCIQNYENRLQNAEYNLKVFAMRNLDDAEKKLNLLQEQCVRIGNERMNQSHAQLAELRHDIEMHAVNLINRNKQMLSDQAVQLKQRASETVTQQRHQIEKLAQSIQSQAVLISANARSELQKRSSDLYNYASMILNDANNQLSQFILKLSERTQEIQSRETQKLIEYQNKIELLNPADLFKRGFVSVSSEDKVRISSADAVHEGQNIIIRLKDGRIHATIQSIEKTKPILDSTD